jgi:hypothetical protein
MTTRSGPSRVRRANETVLLRDRVPRNAPSRFWSAYKLSTRTRSTSLLSTEDRITVMSISIVWISGWIACRAYRGYFSPVVAIPRMRYFCPAMKKPMTGASETTDIANI